MAATLLHQITRSQLPRQPDGDWSLANYEIVGVLVIVGDRGRDLNAVAYGLAAWAVIRKHGRAAGVTDVTPVIRGKIVRRTA